MPERLPSLKALRVFDVAARHLNYSRAAQELFLTHGAVSHQIKALEGELGIKLFRRAGRAMLLTEAGQRLYADIREGFARIEKGVNEARLDKRGQVLNVTTTPSLAARWLVPRLTDFYRRYPSIQVNLRASTALVDFAHDDMDVAIRYGPGNWPRLHAEKLLHEDVFPVASPGYNGGKLPHTAAALLDAVLLHDSYMPWEDWFKSVGVAFEGPLRGPRFNDIGIAIQAAIEGQGVALARLPLVQDELASGELVRLISSRSVLPTPFAYYIVYPRDSELAPKTRDFRDWLLAQVADEKERKST